MAALSKNGTEIARFVYENGTPAIVSIRSNGKIMRKWGSDGWKIITRELAQKIIEHHSDTQAEYVRLSALIV